MNSSTNPELLNREKCIDRYIQALDKGDIDGVIAVLQVAETDPELDRIIGEINLALDEELGLSPLTDDARIIRALLKEHIPSGFVSEHPENRPLTVGEVAAKLEAERRVPEADQELNRKLLHSQRELPEWLSIQEIKRLAVLLQVQASDRFWKVFRETAIMLGMGRGQAQMAAARKKGRSGAAAPKVKRSKHPTDNEQREHDNDD